jgi:O-succinylbenzoate synthase
MLHEVELFRVRLRLAEPFRSARGTLTAKDALLVRVRTDAGEGWGECPALTTPTYTAETLDAARLALRDHLIPRAFRDHSLDDTGRGGAARAALECALLDAQLRADGVSLARHLGAARHEVEAGAAIGLVGDAELRERVTRCVEDGYRRIKCKIEPGRDVQVARAARAAAGDAIAVAADANGTFVLRDAPRLRALDELGLQCIEQPLAPDALADHAALASQLRTRICLDESVTGAQAAADAIALHACDAVSVKPGRLGIAASRAAHDACVAARVPALVGGMLETGVGRAVLLAVAALPGFTLTGDCAASAYYFGPGGDVTEPHTLSGGVLRVPDGPGIGVHVDRARVERCAVARERITRRDAA